MDQGGRRRGRLVDQRACLGERPLHQVAPLEVGGLEGVGEGRGLLGRLGEEQPGGAERLPHPTRRVEPGGDREGDRLQVGRSRVDARPAEQGGDPRPGGRPQAFEADPGDRPVLADDGRHVGDGPDRGEIRERQRRCRAAGHVREERLRDLEGHAAPGDAPVRVPRVRPVRVDHRERRRQVGRHAVVVGDDDVDAAATRRPRSPHGWSCRSRP